MKIFITVKPRSSKIGIVRISDTEFQVKLTASPVDGEANDQLISVLSTYFHIPKSRILIVNGKNSKKKIIELLFR